MPWRAKSRIGRVKSDAIPVRGRPRSSKPKGQGSGQPSVSGRAAASGRGLSSKQRLVLRDIWLYATMLFVITAIVGLLLSNFTLLILAPVSLVCIVGALLLHLASLQRFSRARRNGSEPDTTRIFG